MNEKTHTLSPVKVACGSERNTVYSSSSLCNSAQANSSRCPNPFNRSGKPCYKRRCACQDCRNKCQWRSYIILVRSLARLPATHFLSLNFPIRYQGHDITVRMDRFWRALCRRVGCPLTRCVIHWEYDSSAVGRWPHCHVLVRVNNGVESDLAPDWYQPRPRKRRRVKAVEITTADVLAVWRELWADQCDDDELDGKSVHARDCDGDHVSQAQYMTKHGQDAAHVTDRMWVGRLSGGHRKFFCSSIKRLLTHDHYRYGPDGLNKLGQSILADTLKLTRDYPHLMGGTRPCVYLTRHRLMAGFRAWLVRTGVRPAVLYSFSPTPFHLRTINVYVPPRQQCRARRLLPHALLPIPPPG